MRPPLLRALRRALKMLEWWVRTSTLSSPSWLFDPEALPANGIRYRSGDGEAKHF